MTIDLPGPNDDEFPPSCCNCKHSSYRRTKGPPYTQWRCDKHEQHLPDPMNYQCSNWELNMGKNIRPARRARTQR